MAPSPLGVLRKGLAALKLHVSKRKTKLDLQLKEGKTITDEDSEWLDGAANLIDEERVIDALEHAAAVKRLKEFAEGVKSSVAAVKMPSNKRKRPEKKPVVPTDKRPGKKQAVQPPLLHPWLKRSSDDNHEYIAPREGDLRSVCPAINTMANHGYIPRDGRNITPRKIFHGLRACYNLSLPFALFLAVGGWFLLRKYFFQTITLFDLGVHGGIEHDASVVHADTPTDANGKREKYGPVEVRPELVEEFVRGVRDKTRPNKDDDALLVTAQDVARMRIRRETSSPRLSPFSAELARGEMAIILGVWKHQPAAGEGGAPGAPLSWLRRWFAEERLPDGWKPTHTQTLRDVAKSAKEIRSEMRKLRSEEPKKSTGVVKRDLCHSPIEE
ncbi:Aromatic peroxygenase [Mycena kentingensis (nom. inval.)]|nr:Aromatic peroxygenase [Mycena kentingensis (nom. inval.)]